MRDRKMQVWKIQDLENEYEEPHTHGYQTAVESKTAYSIIRILANYYCGFIPSRKKVGRRPTLPAFPPHLTSATTVTVFTLSVI